jgi:hypothetical protein
MTFLITYYYYTDSEKKKRVVKVVAKDYGEAIKQVEEYCFILSINYFSCV